MVSLGGTAGLREADAELLASLRRAGASAELVRARRVREWRTLALIELAWALAARRAAAAGIAAHAPRAVVYSSTTAALLAPAPGAIRFDAPAVGNRPGRHGIWQRPVERRRMATAPLLVPWSPGGLAEAPAAGAAAVVVPVPVEPSGPPGERDVAAVTYGANPEKKGLDRVLAAWRAARRPGEVLVVAGLDGRHEDGVRYAGMLPREAYRALLRRARAFVCAPRREDYGIAQLEALADGCRLVTTPAPGPYVALPVARELDGRLVTEDLAGGIRIALDEPAGEYAERAAEALAPWRRAAVDRVVAEELVPRLLATRELTPLAGPGRSQPMPPDASTLSGKPARFAGGLHDLGGGVHTWLQPNGALGESNAGLVVGDGESLLIDTLWTPSLTRRMLDAMAQLTAGAPIATVVNTHSDGDHWWGNQLVHSATIVTSQASAELMAEQDVAEIRRFATLGAALRGAGRLPGARGPRTVGAYVHDLLAPFDFSGIELTRPTDTFAGERTLTVGGREARLIETGPAHSTSDVMVHLPAERILFAGDILFIGSTPIMWAGPVANWIAALDRILALDAATIVPGHGPITDAAGVRAVRDYWTFLDAEARRRFAAGTPAARAAREILRSPGFAERGFAAWEAPERIAINVHWLFCEYRGETPVRTPRLTVQLFWRAALLARG